MIKNFYENLKSICEKYNILLVSQFGSYESKEWIKGKSDIDIGVIATNVEDEMYIEEELLELLVKHYNYDIINIIFIDNDIKSRINRNIVCGKTLYTTLEIDDLKRECLYIERTHGDLIDRYNEAEIEKLRKEALS